MKAVLSGKEMKAFDTRSIRGYGIPSLVLMVVILNSYISLL